MLSLPKHLARFVEKLLNAGAVAAAAKAAAAQADAGDVAEAEAGY